MTADRSNSTGDPVPLPSIRQLLQLLQWSQGAPHTLLLSPVADWHGMEKQAAHLLPYLWATASRNPFVKYGDGRTGSAISSLPRYRHKERDNLFSELAGKAGPNATSSAIILIDVAESLDLLFDSPPAALDKTLERVARGKLSLQDRAAELVSAVQNEMEPGSSEPDLPDPDTLLRLLNRIHPQTPYPDTPPWRRIVHEARRIAIFDRSVPRQTWQHAVQAIGPRGAAAAAIIAFARQSLGRVSDPAASIRDSIALSLREANSLQLRAAKLLRHLDDMPDEPATGELAVRVPSIDRVRSLYKHIAGDTLLVPDINACTWFNLHDRIRRIHFPGTPNMVPDRATVTRLLGQRAQTVIAIMASETTSHSLSYKPAKTLWFEAAVRVAQTGPLDLHDLLDKEPFRYGEPYRYMDGSDDTKPLSPLPSVEAIRQLIPETQWAPHSAACAIDYGWTSVIHNTRKLAEVLDITEAQWERLTEILGTRHAAAAVLYAAPRPDLAPAAGLLHRFLDARSSQAAKGIVGMYHQAFLCIETRIDIIIADAVEHSPVKPANHHHLPTADELLTCNLPQVREHLLRQPGEDPDWDALADLARNMATTHLNVSDGAWLQACRKIGKARTAAAAFAVAAALARQNRLDNKFDHFVQTETSNPGLLASLFREGKHSSLYLNPTRYP